MWLDGWKHIEECVQIFPCDNEAPSKATGPKPTITDGFLDGGTPTRTVFGGAVNIERTPRWPRGVLAGADLCFYVHGCDGSAYK
jgi:hypothetical protein